MSSRIAALILALTFTACAGSPGADSGEDDLEHGRAARAVEVVLVNRTSLPLSFVAGGASHGVWKTSVPTGISAGGTGTWETESNGFMTGTQAWISYRIEGVGDIRLAWDDPFSGTNSYQVSAPAGYVIDRVGGPGNRTTVFFHLREASTPHTQCPWQVAQWAVDNLSTPEPGLNPFDHPRRAALDRRAVDHRRARELDVVVRPHRAGEVRAAGGPARHAGARVLLGWPLPARGTGAEDLGVVRTDHGAFLEVHPSAPMWGY